MIKVFSTGKNEYNCKLSTRYLIAIEDKLGESPVNALKVNDDEEVPKLLPLLTILYYSMKSDNPKMSFDEIYDIYDEYCETGEGNIFKLYGWVFNLLKDSGLFFTGKSEDREEEEEPKN